MGIGTALSSRGLDPDGRGRGPSGASGRPRAGGQGSSESSIISEVTIAPATLPSAPK